MLEQYYSYSNESFSGCDMVATILMPKPNSTEKISYVIGELQTISYSIHMDRKPVRSIQTYHTLLQNKRSVWIYS